MAQVTVIPAFPPETDPVRGVVALEVAEGVLIVRVNWLDGGVTGAAGVPSCAAYIV